MRPCGKAPKEASAGNFEGGLKGRSSGWPQGRPQGEAFRKFLREALRGPLREGAQASTSHKLKMPLCTASLSLVLLLCGRSGPFCPSALIASHEDFGLYRYSIGKQPHRPT